MLFSPPSLSSIDPGVSWPPLLTFDHQLTSVLLQETSQDQLPLSPSLSLAVSLGFPKVCSQPGVWLTIFPEGGQIYSFYTTLLLIIIVYLAMPLNILHKYNLQWLHSTSKNHYKKSLPEFNSRKNVYKWIFGEAI